jgi:hypothetical protein
MPVPARVPQRQSRARKNNHARLVSRQPVKRNMRDDPVIPRLVEPLALRR